MIDSVLILSEGDVPVRGRNECNWIKEANIFLNTDFPQNPFIFLTSYFRNLFNFYILHIPLFLSLI